MRLALSLMTVALTKSVKKPKKSQIKRLREKHDAWINTIFLQLIYHYNIKWFQHLTYSCGNYKKITQQTLKI